MEDFWIENVYKLIKYYSNLELQKKAWLGLLPNIVLSYDEMLDMLFDDNHFDDFIVQWEKEEHDKKTLNEMTNFRDMLNTYDNQFTHQYGKNFDKAILKDPNWEAVTKQAQKVIDVWKYE